MALALALLFDDEATAAVERIWSELAAAGISRDMLDLGYPPHLTLTVVEDEARRPQLETAMGRVATLVPEQLGLAAATVFPGTTVTYLAVDGDLQPVHKAATARIGRDDVRVHYRSEDWTPHVTLQTTGDAAAGLQMAKESWRVRQAVRPVRLELVSFPPVVRLAGCDLAAQAQH
jgi:2'-5' RNA ligase